MIGLDRIFAATRQFLKNEHGGLTVEGVLWMPIYVFFLAFIADVSSMLNGQAQAQRIVQDANRLASSGFFQTEEEVEANITMRLSHLTSRAVVDAEWDDVNKTVTTLVAFPAIDVMAARMIIPFSHINVTASAVHRIEL